MPIRSIVSCGGVVRDSPNFPGKKLPPGKYAYEITPILGEGKGPQREKGSIKIPYLRVAENQEILVITVLENNSGVSCIHIYRSKDEEGFSFLTSCKVDHRGVVIFVDDGNSFDEVLY